MNKTPCNQRQKALQRGGTCYLYAGLNIFLLSDGGLRFMERFLHSSNGNLKLRNGLKSFFSELQRINVNVLLGAVRNAKPNTRPFSGAPRLSSYCVSFRSIMGNNGGYSDKAVLRLLVALGFRRADFQEPPDYKFHVIEGLPWLY